MKKYYLAFFFLVSIQLANAQSNFYKLSAGIGAGVVSSFPDVKYGAFSFAVAGNLDYHIKHFITAGLELQSGIIKGGGEDGGPDIHGRQFKNAYKAITINGKFRAGEFTNFENSDFLNYTKGFYVGLGLGAIVNDLENNGFVIRSKPQSGYPGGIYTFPGVSKSTNLLIPTNVGIDFYFPDRWGDIRYILNVNFQSNFTFGEGMDGYDDPQSKFKNKAPDMYNLLSIGARYSFGPMRLSRKSIR